MPVELWACPVRLRYATNVRRGGAGGGVGKGVLLVGGRVPRTTLEARLVLTGLAGAGGGGGGQVSGMDAQSASLSR